MATLTFTANTCVLNTFTGYFLLKILFRIHWLPLRKLLIVLVLQQKLSDCRWIDNIWWTFLCTQEQLCNQICIRVNTQRGVGGCSTQFPESVFRQNTNIHVYSIYYTTNMVYCMCCLFCGWVDGSTLTLSVLGLQLWKGIEHRKKHKIVGAMTDFNFGFFVTPQVQIGLNLHYANIIFLRLWFIKRILTYVPEQQRWCVASWWLTRRQLRRVVEADEHLSLCAPLISSQEAGSYYPCRVLDCSWHNMQIASPGAFMSYLGPACCLFTLSSLVPWNWQYKALKANEANLFGKN